MSNISLLEEKIEYKFKNNKEDIKRIINDKTYRKKPKDPLCTLGDAVLRLILVDEKYSPKITPGELTQEVIGEEKNVHLTKIAREMKIDECLSLKKDKQNQWDNEMKKAAGDLMEGIIGAIYIDMDRDYKKCKEVVEKWLRK